MTDRALLRLPIFRPAPFSGAPSRPPTPASPRLQAPAVLTTVALIAQGGSAFPAAAIMPEHSKCSQRL